MDVIKKLIADLKDPDESKRRDATEKLSTYFEEYERIREDSFFPIIDVGDPAVPLLCKTLKSRDKNVKAWAAATISMIAEKNPKSTEIKKTVPLLVEMVASSEELSVVRNAISALESIGDPQSIPVLIELLKDEDVRREAVVALGEILDANPLSPAIPKVIPLLVSIVEDQDEYVEGRCGAAEVLAKIGGPDVFETITKLYNKGMIPFECAEAFYNAMEKKLGKDFDKGIISSPKKSPGDLDEMKRMLMRKISQNTKLRTGNRKRRGAAGG
jgi:HEAT repeat protein